MYINLKLVGQCNNYDSNGHRESVTNYKNGIQIGEIIRYYPNGNLYAIEKYSETGNLFLIECRDSIGKILSANGNGNWLQFGEHFSKEEFGSVKDSLKEGEWHGVINDSAKYLKMYHKGNFVPTTDTTGTIFLSADQDPGFYGGMKTLYHFLGKKISYPASARENRIQGRVILSFIIEKDGSITNIQVLSGPDSSLKKEAARVINLSAPWIPGMINNQPVRIKVTVPIRFALGT